MPRRIYTYPADRGWEMWNLVTTLGVPLQAVATLIFVVNIIVSLLRGKPASADPWDAWTLEWATTSPPPPYNSRPSRWSRAAGRSGTSSIRTTRTGRTNERPRRGVRRGRGSRVARPRGDDRADHRRGLALRGIRGRLPLLHGEEPPRPVPEGRAHIPLVGTICLFASSATVAIGARALARGDIRRSGRWLLLTAALGAIFLAGTAREWSQLICRDGLTSGTNLFGSTFYPLVGLHASHVIVGLVMLGLCCVFAATGALRVAHAERVEMVSWYWHFVDGAVVLTVVYVIGRWRSRDQDRHTLPAPTGGHWCSPWGHPRVAWSPTTSSSAWCRPVGTIGWWFQVLPEEQVSRSRSVPAERSPRSSPFHAWSHGSAGPGIACGCRSRCSRSRRASRRPRRRRGDGGAGAFYAPRSGLSDRPAAAVAMPGWRCCRWTRSAFNVTALVWASSHGLSRAGRSRMLPSSPCCRASTCCGALIALLWTGRWHPGVVNPPSAHAWTWFVSQIAFGLVCGLSWRACSPWPPCRAGRCRCARASAARSGPRNRVERLWFAQPGRSWRASAFCL